MTGDTGAEFECEPPSSALYAAVRAVRGVVGRELDRECVLAESSLDCADLDPLESPPSSDTGARFDFLLGRNEPAFDLR